jgi:glycosyltransferase involved in cell wall biosynthesis
MSLKASTHPHICVLTFSYPRTPGDDAGIFVKRLVGAYKDAGVSGIVVVPHDRDEPTTEVDGAFTIHRIPYGVFSRGGLAFGAGIMPNIRRSPLLAIKIPSMIFALARALWRLRNSYDVIHANWIPSPMIAHVIALVTKKPYIVTIRGEDLRLAESKFLRPIFSPSIKNATAITCVSESFTQKMRELFSLPKDTVHHIANGIELHTISREAALARVAALGYQAPKNLLLFAGSVVPRKGIETIIEALKHPALSHYTLWCCGRMDDPPYHAHLLNRARECSVESRVVFPGAVPPHEIPAFFKCAAYYVTASTFEGRPNAVLEALAAGVPVVASDIPAHREVLNNGASGALFSDSNHLGEVIAELDRNSEKTSHLVANGSAAVQAQSWEETARRYLQIIKPSAD